MYIIGLCLSDNTISKEQNYISIKTSSSKDKIAIVLDKDILGTYPAKTLRKSLIGTDKNVDIINNLNAIRKDEYPCIILFGTQVEKLNLLLDYKGKIVLINPIGSTPKIAMEKLILKLPRLDTYNQNPKWSAYAKPKNFDIEYINATSTHIETKELTKILKSL